MSASGPTRAFKARPAQMAVAFKGAAEPDGREMIALCFGDDPDHLEMVVVSPRVARGLHTTLGEALVAPLPKLPS